MEHPNTVYPYVRLYNVNTLKELRMQHANNMDVQFLLIGKNLLFKY